MSDETPSEGVLIAICSGDLVHAEFARDLINMTGHLHHHKFPHGIGWFMSSLIQINRNAAAQAAIDSNASHVLMIDTDMLFPYSSLQRLHSHDLDIVGASYLNRHPPRRMNHLKLDGTFDDPETELSKVDYVATGMLMIKTSVFKRVPFPWFHVEHHAPTGQNSYTGEDVFFCRRARQHGVDVWMDWNLTYHLRHNGTVALGMEHKDL